MTGSHGPRDSAAGLPGERSGGRPDESPGDADLLAAHVAGDPEAFGLLFARHRDRLWAVALRTMGNPTDAEDGLQDALIAAFRRADTFRGQSAVTTWLHRVVVNACLDRIRAGKVRAAFPAGDDLVAHLESQPRTTQHTLAPDAPDPAEVAVGAERRDQVLAALQRLPAEQRAALVLVDMEGYSVAEAAEMLGCAVGTVKSRCSRGRAVLAVALGHLRVGSRQPPGNQPRPGPVPSMEQPRGPPI